MARVLLVQPWNYHDEGRRTFDLAYEWRNGPYNLLLLATLLKRAGHQVRLVDMHRDLVVLKGDVGAALSVLDGTIAEFRPDIVGFSFFSIHYFEVRTAVETARRRCESLGIDPIFVAGGIHATVEPEATVRELGFDYAFAGEGDIGLVKLADGAAPSEIPGLVGRETPAEGGTAALGEQVRDLDALPYPDWSFCDYAFYAHPSYARLKFRSTGSLDLIMGRGCVYKCAFCAYNALSSVRFYSPEYLLEQVEAMHRDYGVTSVYFTDSTIGNNRKQLRAFCELMIARGTAKRVTWLANIRPNQVNEEQLKLMWRAGCRYLLYGFESNSQRVLDLMSKGMKVELNEKVAEIHNRLKFPYNGSMLLGYPGEREEDILESLAFLRRTRPPSVGINWYVPLPGSPDYDALKARGEISTDDPMEWRRIGEVNGARVYADVPEDRFRELFQEAERIAYTEIPSQVHEAWKLAVATSMPESGEHPGLRRRYPFNFRRRLVDLMSARQI